MNTTTAAIWAAITAEHEIQALDEPQILLTMFDTLAKAMEYEGFDPVATFKLLIQKHAAVKKVGYKPIAFTGGSVDIGKSTLTDDLQILCTLFAARGANIRKVADTSSEAMKTLINNLITKYDIKSRGTEGRPANLARGDITMGRIAAVAPYQVCEAFYRGHAIPIVSWADVLGTGDHEMLKEYSYMLSPSFVSLIPIQSPPNILIEIAKIVAFYRDRVVNRVPTETGKLMKYVSNAYRTKIMGDKTRRAARAALGFSSAVVAQFDGYEEEVAASANVCQTGVYRL